MLEIKYDELPNEDLIQIYNDASRVLNARRYDAARKLKIGSLVTYKQIDGSSHNYLIINYDETFEDDNVFYFFKALHYYISPDGKIKLIGADSIDEDYATTRLRLLDPLTTVRETDLKEGEYKDRLDALNMEIIEEFAMDGSKKDEEGDLYAGF